MNERRRPEDTAWSLLWLIVAGTAVMWFVTRVLAAIWPWLLAGAAVVACVWLLVSWLRRGRERL